MTQSRTTTAASPRGPVQVDLSTRFGLSIVLVTSLSALIGAVNLTRPSLWIDEAYTVTVATRSLPDLWRMIANIDIVHSLYNLLLHPWFATVGISEMSIRLPSLILVAVATPGVMVLTRRLYSAPAAIAAGLVFAVLPRVTWMAIEGRSYAMTTAVAVWLTVLFVSLLDRPSWGKRAGYAALVAFAGSLNIFLVLILGAHGMALLASRGLRFSRAFWAWLGTALVGLAGALPVLLTAVSQSGQIGDTQVSGLGYLRQILVNQWFVGGTPTVYLGGTAEVFDGPGWQLWKPAAVLLAAGCWLIIAYAVLRRAPDEPGGTLGYRAVLVSWVVVPTVILAGYAVVAAPLYNPRYLSYCAPAVAALLGIGLIKLRQLPGRLGWSSYVAAGLIVALALPVYASQRTVYAKAGADWRLVAEFVEAHPGPDRAVYFAPRVPPTSDVVSVTSRTAQTLYPHNFEGIRDLTLLSTPAADANLLGRSRLLADSVEELAGVRTVFVINRVDYPPVLVSADEALLTDAGFTAGDRWSGVISSVVVYTR